MQSNDGRSFTTTSLQAGSDAEQRPARMTITNVETAELIEAQFNPDELKEKLEAGYNEAEVGGHSHKPMQYKGTSNLAISFRLSLDGLSVIDNRDGAKLDNDRRFLHSLFYPMRGGGGTPRVLLVWPHLYSITCRVQTLEGEFTRFAKDGHPTLYSANLTIKEALVRKIFSEDVRIAGTIRS